MSSSFGPRKCAAALVWLAVTQGSATQRLAYATFLPGPFSVGSFGYGLTAGPPVVAADTEGNTYIAVTNASPPVHGGAFTFDSYAMKVSAGAGGIAFIKHLQIGITTAIAVDTAGNIYVTGGTDQSHGYVAKLSPDGSVLYTLSLPALPLAVAADASGEAYVTSVATSDLKTTPGAYQAGLGGAHCTDPSTKAAVPCSEAFVAKISKDGSGLIYATFLGGTGGGSGQAIVVDQTGSVVVAGQTSSSDFPVTQNAFQPAYGGGGDGFVARLDPMGKSLVYGTFVGGSSADAVNGIALDGSGNAYATGTTSSPDFPVTQNAFQPAYGGGGDALFLKLSPDGGIAFSSYAGGPTADSGRSVVLGPGHRFYVAVSDQTYRMQPKGAFVLSLDQRSQTPCDPTVAILAIDGTSGQVVDHYVLGEFGGSDVMTNGLLSIDGAGIVHIAVDAAIGGDSFIVAPGANSGGYDSPTYLARVDFAGTEELAPSCMVNAASFEDVDVSVAPGEIVSLFGTGLGPAEAIAAQPDAEGTYPRQVGGTTISIGGVDLPLLYASNNQVNAVVPYSFSTGSIAPGTSLVVKHGQFQASYALRYVFPAFPGIFTQGGFYGFGAAALNQDGSINGPAHPAPVGSLVSFFATALGPLTGTLPDDAATPLTPPWPSLAESFQVFIQAKTSSGAAGMEVLYAGPAPGMPPGVYQVNARIPDNAVSGAADLSFNISSCHTGLCGAGGVHIWVQAD